MSESKGIGEPVRQLQNAHEEWIGRAAVRRASPRGWGRLGLKGVVLLSCFALLAAACAPDDTAEDPADTAVEEPDDGVGDADDTEEDVQAAIDELEPATYSIAKQFPPTGPRSEVLIEWAERINDRTDGKIEFEFHWQNALVDPTDVIDSVQAGIADGGILTSTYEPARTPLWSAIDMPFNFGWNYYCPTRVPREVAAVNEDLAEEFRTNGMHPLMGYVSGQQFFMTADGTRIESIEDMRGRRSRVYSPVIGQWLDKMGASAIFQPLGEIYEAFDRGVTDTVMLTAYLLQNLGIDEIGTEVGQGEFGGAAAYTIGLSYDHWDNFPPEVQSIFEEEAQWHDETLARTLMELDDQIVEEWEEQGIDVYDIPDDVMTEMRELSDETIEEWMDEREAEGHPVREVWDQYNEMLAECEADVEENGYPWER